MNKPKLGHRRRHSQPSASRLFRRHPAVFSSLCVSDFALSFVQSVRLSVCVSMSRCSPSDLCVRLYSFGAKGKRKSKVKKTGRRSFGFI